MPEIPFLLSFILNIVVYLGRLPSFSLITLFYATSLLIAPVSVSSLCVYILVSPISLEVLEGLIPSTIPSTLFGI